MRPLRVLTWHVHGSYLALLGHIGHTVLVPVRPGRPARWTGLPPGRTWPPGLVEVPADQVASTPIDAVLYQCDENWMVDRHEVLGDDQLALPFVYLEHDPPGHAGGSCFDSVHPVDDGRGRIVHVTHYNALMWDTGAMATQVIEHSGIDIGPTYTGELERGVVVGNHIARRGRRLGADVVERVGRQVPLDVIGMGSEQLGGLGEVAPDEVAGFTGRYRFSFHPARHTSLGLSVVDAMMAGIPVVALATTEAPTVITDGVDGYVHASVGRLVEDMRRLLADPVLAQRMGRAARRTARRRFSLDRFAAEWTQLFDELCAAPTAAAPPDGARAPVS